ncbi:MAG: L,D-transpeptidase family protein, partial [Bacteroidetes bacterium]|nr:L,D-transpeptidase family protein [Bacteroidota bacterium]
MKTIKLSSLRTFLLVTSVVFCSSSVFASCNASGAGAGIDNDTTVSAYIQRYLGNNRLMLSYPKSVARFYHAYGTEAAWVNQSDTRHTWQAMLLLDCVKLYGLSANDYHPKELLYEPLHTMIEEPGTISNEKKARFDMLLTDALITLMNNMHYGKLNPDYSSDKLDDGLALPFDAETALLSARQQEKFMRAIESAQPRTKQYTAMQDKLRQLKGVRQGDCYETPDAEVTKIVINMERLRWAAIDTNFYIQVNIPSFTLKFVRPDTTYQFKVVVGKTTAPTPTLNSNITYLTTFPEWKIPQKIFIRELVPKGLRNPDFFENNHFSVY